MPLKEYGVLKGRAVARVREDTVLDTPHYQLHLVDDDGVNHRVAVNVKSKEAPSELLYVVDNWFTHPVTDQLEALPSGWTPLPGARQGLDYIRGNLFSPGLLRPLPAEAPGPENDLADLLDLYVRKAIEDPAAQVYAFGEPWGPEQNVPDKVFGFLPGAGVHDVHANQGNSPAFYDDDGVWQDGALLLRFPGHDAWVAIFLMFQSQAWHTDDTTGHDLGVPPDGAAPRPGAVRGRIKIVAALPNPSGALDEDETVTLLNVTPETIDLAGWSIVDGNKQGMNLLATTVHAGECVRVTLVPPVKLSNGGGLITLLDPHGLKIDGVAYTSRDARPQGWTVSFMEPTGSQCQLIDH